MPAVLQWAELAGQPHRVIVRSFGLKGVDGIGTALERTHRVVALVRAAVDDDPAAMVGIEVLAGENAKDRQHVDIEALPA